LIKYQIKTNLSESQIESDVANYFGWISKDSPFRLYAVNEQLTGADKKFYDSGFAFFMQFKKSEGLYPTSAVPVSNRKGRSKLEDIREFRENHGLSDDPILYFPLRKKAKNANDFQHNVLLKYANKSFSQAFYVAPLVLDKQEYYRSLYDSVDRFQSFPFNYNRYRLYREDWVSTIGFIPFLKEHISIIPHERITTHEHFYSFSETGYDVGWHSPEIISRSPMRLGDILRREIQECVLEKKFLELHHLSKMLGIDSHKIGSKAEEPLSMIKYWGEEMYNAHGIKVFVLLANRNLLEYHLSNSPN
jgi:hypothetical protein